MPDSRQATHPFGHGLNMTTGKSRAFSNVVLSRNACHSKETVSFGSSQSQTDDFTPFILLPFFLDHYLE